MGTSFLMKVLLFLKYYLKSMRLYYGFVTLSAGCVGMALYEGTICSLNQILLPVILFGCWGVNQIINDYLNLEEDKINAPSRPMACGKLNARAALWLSTTAIVGILFYALWQNGWACVPIAVGVLANIYYSKTKNILLFAFSISCCTWFAYVLLGGGLLSFFAAHSGAFLGVVGCNAWMTFFTYFKDEKGDKAVGKRTPQVIFGNQAMRSVGLVLGILPFVLILGIVLYTRSWHQVTSWIFLTGGIFTTLTGILFYKPSHVQADYYHLKYAFTACCVLQSSLVGLYYPQTGVALAFLCIMGVLSIFSRGYTHADE